MRHDPLDHPLATCACGRKMGPGEYVCGWCKRYGQQPEGLAVFGKFVAPPRVKVQKMGLGGTQNMGLTLCDLCPPSQFAECRECVLNNRVLACEWAVAEDAERGA